MNVQKKLAPFDAWLDAIDQQQAAVLMTITEASLSQKIIGFAIWKINPLLDLSMTKHWNWMLYPLLKKS